MPTLLATSKMSPALRARVEASVRGRATPSGRRSSASLLGLLRLTLLVVMVLAVGAFVNARKRAHEELERERGLLLERQRREASTLTAEQRGIVGRVQAALARLSGAFPADTVADELRTPGAFTRALSRPAVYVRGPVEAFARPASLAESARTSFTDALVLCLLDPPASRAEKVLLSRARAAYGGGERVERVAGNVVRLHHAIVGLPFLAPEWAARVTAAADARTVAELERLLSRAPLAAARAAAKAEVLLFAMDEPGNRAIPAELDGERPHQVRVGLFDLATQKLLFGLRRAVDPSNLSATARAEHASGIDSCALAVAVRDAITSDPTPVKP